MFCINTVYYRNRKNENRKYMVVVSTELLVEFQTQKF